MLRQLLQPVIRQARSGVRSYHVPADVKPPHMNELPVPCGSWQEAANKQRKSQNTLLAIGVVVFTITVAIGRSTGLLFLNYSPPTLEKK